MDLQRNRELWRDPRGARLRFAYLDRDSDAEGYQGHSYTRVYIEEIGNFPSRRRCSSCLPRCARAPAFRWASGRLAILAGQDING